MANGHGIINADVMQVSKHTKNERLKPINIRVSGINRRKYNCYKGTQNAKHASGRPHCGFERSKQQ